MKARHGLTSREADELHVGLLRRLGDTSIPTLPQVAVRILELIANSRATIQDFTEVIKTDQALTGRLLRLANSAQYAQRTPVTRLERAMVLMGMDRLKAMALGFHLSKAAAADEGAFSFKRTWTQSLFRGFLAMKLAEKVNRDVSGEAFIVGLMCDCGGAMMPKLVGEQYAHVVNPEDPPSRQYLAESCSLPFTHVDVSIVLSRLWKLPEILAKPIAAHHTAAAPADTKDKLSVLTAVAHFAGSFALGEQMRKMPEPAAGMAKRLLNLELSDVEAAITAAAAEFTATKDFFKHVMDHTLTVDEIVNRANAFIAPEESAALQIPAGQAPRVEASRYTAGGMIVELEKTPGGLIAAYIADSSGARLVSEMIDPKSQSDDQIRSALLLDMASKEEVGMLLEGVRKMAA